MMNFKLLLALAVATLAGAATTRYLPVDGMNMKGQASITTPGTGYYSIAVKSSDGNAYIKNSSGTETQLATAAGAGASVLTKTSNYTILTGDFSSNKQLMLECNCTADCTITFPAASNTGYEIDLINIGTATCTAALAGSDTYGSTADQTWGFPPSGSPQASNIFKANGGTRWNGF